MTKTSQQFLVPQEKIALFVPSQGLTILKIASGLLFAGVLALAPAPAFAQHGGGGGGASHGGFGGGGGSARASASGGGSHASGASGGSGSNNSGGGHWWNPFHSGSSGSAASAKGASSVPAGNIKSESSAAAAPERFAVGNNTWQEPPSASARAAARVNYYGPANVNGSRPFVPLTSTTRVPVGSAHGGAMVAAAQHPFQPRRPGYPYYPYYPYFSGFGFGWGGFGPCDPFWGCYGYGFGYGFGGGLGYFGGIGAFGGGSSGYGPGWTDASSEVAANVTSPDNVDSYLYAAPGTWGAQVADSADATQAAPADSAPQQVYVLLYLKDGSSFAVTDYWMTGGKLHYVTSYGGENAVNESQIDLQRTVNENAARGVDFSLRPQPAARGDAAVPAPAQNPEPQKP
jgi:hypothetical protein